MVQAGDFLLLNDHQIVLVSNIVEALESNATTYNSIAYYKKCLKELDDTDHKFGIFYEEVEFDVEDQSFSYSDPTDDGGIFSIDLREFSDKNHQSSTLIFNSYFGFVSLRDDSENEYENYNSSIKQLDERIITVNFWNKYAEIFDSLSKFGIPYFSDLDTLDKDQLKADKRIQQFFSINSLFEQPFYAYAHWQDVNNIENSIGGEISGLLCVCLASTRTNTFSSQNITTVINRRGHLTTDNLDLMNLGTSLVVFKGYKELFIVCYRNGEYELIGKYDSLKEKSHESKY